MDPSHVLRKPRSSISQEEHHTIHQAASVALTQNSLMLNPQYIPLLEELSLDKLNKFELAAIIEHALMPHSCLCQKYEYGSIERYSQEDNKDWCESIRTPLSSNHPGGNSTPHLTRNKLEHFI